MRLSSSPSCKGCAGIGDCKPAGYEFLDAARNDTIWKKAADKIKQSGVHVTVSLLAELLKKLLKESLGLP